MEQKIAFVGMPRFMHRTWLARFATLSPAYFIWLAPSIALGADAPTPVECSTSYESAQLLRQTGKLIAAREAAATCSRASCPGVVRNDCATWAGEIERQIPSVIIVARDESTGDERGSRVSVDGTVRGEAASGRAFELDPGTHVVRIERAGDETLEQTITVVQGERDRVLRFVLHAVPVRAAPIPPAPEPPRAQVSYTPAAIVGGVAVLALGTSAWLGVSGRSDLSALRGSCAPSCTDVEVDPVRRKLIASDVLLGVGLVAAGVSLYFVLRPPSSGEAPVARVGVSPSSGGARVTLDAWF
jgi:hypothetical protein